MSWEAWAVIGGLASVVVAIFTTTLYLVERYGKKSSEDATTRTRLAHVEDAVSSFRSEVSSLREAIDALSRAVTRLVTIEEQRSRNNR